MVKWDLLYSENFEMHNQKLIIRQKKKHKVMGEVCINATFVKHLKILTKKCNDPSALYPFRALAAYINLVWSRAICELFLLF